MTDLIVKTIQEAYPGQVAFTPKQTAPIIGVSVMTLQRMRHEGIGPKWRRVGGRNIVYPITAIVDYLSRLQKTA